jgi:hypothetical protein
MFFQTRNIKDFTNVRQTYTTLIEKYKKAIYLKGSMMRENLFGLNNLIRDRVDLK